MEAANFAIQRAIFPGGGKSVDAKNIPAEFTKDNLKGDWPEYGKLQKTVPSFGFYVRHIKGLILHEVELTTLKKDARTTIVIVDVNKLK